jgi:type I restriction enzyme S subunit
MKPWPSVRLGEVLRAVDTSVPVSELNEVNLAGVYSFARGLFKRGPMSPGETSYKTYNRLVRDDFVISVPKAWEGALARVTPEFEGLFLSPVFPTFRANRARLEPAFLEWFCKRESVWTQLQRKSRGIGARRESVHPEEFLSLEIPLPPLPEQRRVVARIEALAAQIHEVRTLRHQAAEEAEALRSAGSNTFFISAARRFGASRLEDLSSRITKGESPEWQGFIYQDTGPLFIRSENVLWGKLDPRNAVHIPRAFHEKLSRCQLGKDDLLINLIGASIGRACAVPGDLGDANVNQAVGVITPNRERLLPNFPVYFLLSPVAQDEIHGSKVETARPNISLGDIRDLEIPTPTLPEQRRIVVELDALQAEVDTLKRRQAETAAELDALLPAILDRAFKGAL